jgi:hypothetical protein
MEEVHALVAEQMGLEGELFDEHQREAMLRGKVNPEFYISNLSIKYARAQCRRRPPAVNPAAHWGRRGNAVCVRAPRTRRRRPPHWGGRVRTA